MTYFILLVIVAAVAATVHAIVRDDRGQLPPPTSHSVDQAFRPPASLLNRR
ncbi:hypothetical protein [Nocardioides bizhenqiangii]|uniref:Uncharacterized protein n=1 Tax=Nocardioides bizhenqiangii TaxID=3095076 RepID=A0ABZ0ZKW2_9ACTN|nr:MULTISPECIES: hypothetical protein [unclassified Nocardioides]MDZ5620565.1 hypothetical protein [Nocardioides sp. HM23]WQQ24935.1 hypothetical protein SHK19_13270 [Nocardioides sp. HM61]